MDKFILNSSSQFMQQYRIGGILNDTILLALSHGHCQELHSAHAVATTTTLPNNNTIETRTFQRIQVHIYSTYPESLCAV
jgi:hypothetical protein